MNIFIQTARETEAEVGERYFVSLYGFSPGQIGHQIPLHKVCSETPVIVDNHIHGWIIWKEARIPVFQKPQDLSGQGEELLSYADGTASYPCAVRDKDTITISLDIFSHLGLCLSGYPEKIWGELKDRKKEIVVVPFADYYADFLFSCILSVQKNAFIPLVHKSFWPDGKSCAVCLTHDVDEIKKTYQWITYPLKLIKRRDLRSLRRQLRSFIQKIKGHEPYWTFDEIFRIEGSRGVKSSFYFLKETGEVRISDRRTWRHLGRRYDFNDRQVLDLFSRLHSGGWETGLHGSFYSYLDARKLRTEKAALEHALGTAVTGGRQHNLNLKIPETWLNQEKAGLSYDTTLGYNDCCGFRWGISFPFRPCYLDENRNLDIVEIPLAIEDLPYFRSEHPWDDFLTIFNHVERLHGVLTLLWHHSVFNENEFPGWSSAYEKILDHTKKQHAWIGSAQQVCDWWTWREKTTLDWQYEGTILKISPYPKDTQHYIRIYFPGSTKIKEVNNARVIWCTQGSCEIKTDVLTKEEWVELTFDSA